MTALAHVWVTCGEPTAHRAQPAVRREVEDYGAWVEIQLDPTAVVAAILEAVGTPRLRAHVAGFRCAEAPEARAEHLREIIADPRVITACRILLTLPTAEHLGAELTEASVEPEPCSVRSCERFAAWGGACHVHGG